MNRTALTLKAAGVRLARPAGRLRDRLQARRAGFGPRPEVAEVLPEPVLFGDADAGRRLLEGEWLAAGEAVAVGDGSIWAPELADPRRERARQSFPWLDDLAALGTRNARRRAHAWTLDWIRRYGRGAGPGWAPEIVGRRLTRWVAHAALLSGGLDAHDAERLWRSLAAQRRFLDQAWERAGAGLPQVEALSGRILAGLVLPGHAPGGAVAELGRVSEALIDPAGGVAGRNPEELAEILILLIWTARLLGNAGLEATPAQLAAISRTVPVLRCLRLGDGSVARFHGGGSGHGERIDQALAELRLGPQPKPRLAMGFARLTGGRAAVVMDGAAPPTGAAATTAHAGTLAFEMSVGRQPLVVNAGPGRDFGPEHARHCRRTAAHSTVEISGRSSARLRESGLAARTFGARLEGGPTLVSVRQAYDASGMWLLATHDGYVAAMGLLHERRLFVDARGRELRGEDIVYVTDARARALFDRHAAGRPDGRVTLAARFHLHPDVAAVLDEGRQVVELALPGGELWGFRTAGATVDIEPSVYFDESFAEPRQARQLVVRADITEYLGQLNWSFAKLADAAPSDDSAPARS